MPAATRYASRPPAPWLAPPSAHRIPNVTTPPRRAPGAKVAQAASVVRRLAPSPASPIVSTIENPHGDQAPVRPTKRAAAARVSSSKLIVDSPFRPRPPTPRSAWHVGLVVGDAEDLAPSVAIAGQRGVAVDPLAVVRAAVPELAHPPTAAPVPG